MKFSDLIKPHIAKQPIYEPGRPIETVARELGLNPKEIIKLASNENPLGASPRGLAAAREALQEVHRYPDGGCWFLLEKLAARHQLGTGQFILGNGSNEVIELLGHTFLNEGDEVVMGTPAFIVYKLVTLLFGAIPVEVPLQNHRHDLAAMRAAVTKRTKMVFLPSPNNPTGTANEAGEILEFARSLPEGVIFVFDEAYAEYLPKPPDLRPLIEEGRLVICLRTFSKIFGLAGFRIGYGYGPEEGIQLLHRARQPFNVNAIAQAAAIGALGDEEFLQRSRTENAAGLVQLEKGIARLSEHHPVEMVPSKGNFVMVRIDDALTCFAALQKAGVICRPLAPYGLTDFLRVSVGTESENERFLDVLEDYFQ
ncbi:MAG: histidinol-phosphate transaminase [Opitutales bacterium]|nr:histidinol-phosphate transaminase [Opitutales bacterium]